MCLVDRLVYRKGEDDPRFADSVETAFASGDGHAVLVLPDPEDRLNFNQDLRLPRLSHRLRRTRPEAVFVQQPVGACPECQGFGRAMGIDMDLVVPDTTKTLGEGAIQPWTTPKFREWFGDLATSGILGPAPFGRSVQGAFPEGS